MEEQDHPRWHRGRIESVDRYRLRRRLIGFLLAGSASALFTALLLLLYEWRLM